MTIAEAKTCTDRAVKLSWLDRKGAEQSELVYVYNVGFVPLYGPCLITDKGEIRIERVVSFVSPRSHAA